MIVDHRTYTLHPGKINEFLKIYGSEGYSIQTEHLGEPFGWFTSMDIGELNQIVHLWRYENLSDREQRRAKLLADPRWQSYLPKVSPLIVRMENKILHPAPFFRIG